MAPERFFIDEGNKAAYDLGYADGLQDGSLGERLRRTETIRDIREQTRKDLTDKYGSLTELRKSVKNEQKKLQAMHNALKKRQTVAGGN